MKEMRISSLMNFMKCNGWHLCLASMKTLTSDYCWCAKFSRAPEGTPEMPDPVDGCGMYEVAIINAAKQIFAQDAELAYRWAEHSLKYI
jgi:hypothetical protein